MDSKLTLKLNRESISRARRYAESHGTSLSRLVEEYFNTFALRSEQELLSKSEFAGSVVGRILGLSASLSESQRSALDLDRLRAESLERRYGSGSS